MSVQYEELSVARIKEMMGDRILVDWEEKHDLIKVGTTYLKRPDTHKGIHYTGIVLMKGPDVSDEINIGDRILFEQFSGFEKFTDPEYGRVAIIREADAKAVLPPREEGNIESGEEDFNYDV